MEPAVFLDRDGVINYNALNSLTGQWESPHHLQDFQLFPWAIQALRKLQKNKFKLFLISNQPGYAKGKATLKEIKAIADKLNSVFVENKIFFTEYFYCYHHPAGVVAKLAVECSCRKPGIAFIQEAEKKYSLSLNSSWMIGDRDSDISCGRRAGIKTVLIVNAQELSAKKAGQSTPDFKADNLSEAVNIIIKEAKKGR